jgi:hypothetical protein
MQADRASWSMPVSLPLRMTQQCLKKVVVRMDRLPATKVLSSNTHNSKRQRRSRLPLG